MAYWRNIITESLVRTFMRSGEGLAAEREALRDLDERVAGVLELDIRRDVPAFAPKDAKDRTDGRIPLPPRQIGAAVRRRLPILQVQVRDARVILAQERHGVEAAGCEVADVEIDGVVLRIREARREALWTRDFVGVRQVRVTVVRDDYLVSIGEWRHALRHADLG